MRFELILMLIFSASVSGCGKSEAQEAREIDARIQVLGEQYVRARLKDPSTAEFRNQFIGKKGAPCGEVNAKNGFGGFNGFERYIIIGKNMSIMESDMKPGEFDVSWSQICK